MNVNCSIVGGDLFIQLISLSVLYYLIDVGWFVRL